MTETGCKGGQGEACPSCLDKSVPHSRGMLAPTGSWGLMAEGCRTSDWHFRFAVVLGEI